MKHFNFKVVKLSNNKYGARFIYLSFKEGIGYGYVGSRQVRPCWSTCLDHDDMFSFDTENEAREAIEGFKKYYKTRVHVKEVLPN